MDLDIHKLRIFVAIAHSGGFTRAAETLYMTQPTVSQQLAQLEAQIGTVLIERRGRRVRLTAAGDALLPYAEQLLSMAGAATEAARAAAGLADRTLRLGAGHTLATYLLPGLLSRYRATHPQHRLRITVGNTAELLDLLEAETVDLAIVGTPADRAGIVVTPFMRDRLVVVVAPDDPWSARTEIFLPELYDRTLLTREPGSALHASVERLIGAAALASDAVIQLGETEAIKRSVEAGLGVALVQSIAVEREVAAGRLRALELRGGDTERTYAWARIRRSMLAPAAQSLVDLLGMIERK